MQTANRSATLALQVSVVGDEEFRPLDAAIRALGWDDPSHVAGSKRAAERLRVHWKTVGGWRTGAMFPTGKRLRSAIRFLRWAENTLREKGTISAGLDDLRGRT